MDIAWKIIAGIAALFLLVAGIFGFQNKDALNKEKLALDASLERRSLANKTEGNAIRYKESQEGFLATYEVERDKAIDDEKEVVAQTGEVKAETAAKQNQADALAAQIQGIEAKLVDYKDIPALIEAATNLTADVAAAEAGIANRSQYLELVSGNINSTRTEIEGYRELVARQNGGDLASDYRAKVTGYNPEWQFVVLNRGNLGATYHNALLDVQRGGATIGQVRVTNVEQNRSAATVVDDTFAEGVLPQAGDTLVPAPDLSVEGLEGMDTPDGMGADVNAAGPDSSAILPPPTGAPDPGDPFDGMGGMGGADEGDSDPFGAMDSAPDPAPAPAEGGDADPFGALKPAAGSPDPFAN